MSPPAGMGTSGRAATCYWKDMWQKLNSMRYLWQLCDITLFSKDDAMFMAHSAVIAASSDIFHAHLIGEYSPLVEEISPRKLKLKSIASDVLQITLDFIYGVLPTSIADLEKLKHGTEELRIIGAASFCTERIKQLQKENIESAAQILCPFSNMEESRNGNSQLPMEATKAQRPAFLPIGNASPFSQTSPSRLGSSQSPSLEGKSRKPLKEISRSLQNSDVEAISPSREDGSLMPVPISPHHATLTLEDMQTKQCPHLQKLAKESGLKVIDVDSPMCEDPTPPVRVNADCDGASIQEEENPVPKCDNRTVTEVSEDDETPIATSTQFSSPHLQRMRSDESSSIDVEDYSQPGSPCEYISSRIQSPAHENAVVPIGQASDNHEDPKVSPCKRNAVDLQSHLPLSKRIRTKYEEEIQSTVKMRGALESGLGDGQTLQPDLSAIQRCPFMNSGLDEGAEISSDHGSYMAGEKVAQSQHGSAIESLLIENKRELPKVKESVDRPSGIVDALMNGMNLNGNKLQHPKPITTPSTSSSINLPPPNGTHTQFNELTQLLTEPRKETKNLFNPIYSTRLIKLTPLTNPIISDNPVVSSSMPQIQALPPSVPLTSSSSSTTTASSSSFPAVVIRPLQSYAPELVQRLISPSATIRPDFKPFSSYSVADSGATLQSNSFKVENYPNADPLETNSDVESTFGASGKSMPTMMQLLTEENSSPESIKNGKNSSFSGDSQREDSLPSEREELIEDPNSQTSELDDINDIVMDILPENAVLDTVVDKRNGEKVKEKKRKKTRNGEHPKKELEKVEECKVKLSEAEIENEKIVAELKKTKGKHFSQLSTHLKRSHAEKPPGPAPRPQCPDCGQTYDSMCKLQTHQIKAHGKGKLFCCQHCSFKSPRKKDVQAHLLSQHNESPDGVRVFECRHCGYRCIDRNRFEEHEAKHTGIGRFSCPLCDKTYTTRRGMRTHQTYHSTERPHVCTECDASFKVKAKLKDHVRLVHTSPGVKPYQCGYCSHHTALRGNCNQHIRKHHPGKPLCVIDHMADKRRLVKPYDYAQIHGEGIQEVKDVRAVSWAENR